jgi:sphinganine C4-monooxygenase
MNTTLVSPQLFTAADEGLSSATCTVPWYHTSEPLLGIPDGRWVLLAPLLAYWAWSGFYAVLDASDAGWLARRRIHARTAADARNLAQKAAVLRAVLTQQAVQTAFAWWWIQEVPALPHAAHCLCVHVWATRAKPALVHIFGPAAARNWAPALGYATYWWLGPIIQLMAAM